MAVGGYVRAADLPQVLPVFPLDGALLLPHAMLPLNIFEPRYLNMIDDAMSGDRLIGMVQTRGASEAERPPLAGIGCAGRVTSYAETADGRYLITLTGVCRFRLGPELPTPTPYRQVRADFVSFEHDLRPAPEEPNADREGLLRALHLFLERRELAVDWRMAKEAPLEALVNSLAMALPFDPPEKQALLEAESLDQRLHVLTALLRIGAAGPDDETPPSIQ